MENFIGSAVLLYVVNGFLIAARSSCPDTFVDDFKHEIIKLFNLER